MSRASKLTLAATSLFALSTLVVVHLQQQLEQQVSQPRPRQTTLLLSARSSTSVPA